jgi:type I restriction enzyme S subunit
LRRLALVAKPQPAPATSGALSEGWRRVRFGEVVRNANEQEPDPLEASIERYVGLEHLDPGSLHIRRWGLVEGGTTFTRKFSKGQVLFPKRRVYQRKVGVAEFDGVCSGDILVFEAKREELLPELLPFIVESEAFFEHALQTSAGSLSPRTRWRDLARYEFPLPPKEEQRRIGEILWAADEAIVRSFELLEGLHQSKQAMLGELTSQSPRPWGVARVGDVITICQYGLSVRATKDGRYPMLGMANIEGGRVLEGANGSVDLSQHEFEAYRLLPGDILFNRTNSADLVGKLGIYELTGDHVFASYLVRLRADPNKIRPKYLNYYLNSKEGQRRLRAYATPGVSQTNINASNLKKVIVPLPPIDDQDEILSKLQRFEAAADMAREHATSLQQLQRRLRDALLGHGIV